MAVRDNVKRRENIKHFVEQWSDPTKYDEKQYSQSFWNALLRDVLCVERPEEVISYESRVKLSHTSYIDAYIPSTKILIEQKSAKRDLREKIPQSDGTELTPFQQAKRYATQLPRSLYPRYVVTCNFKSFLVYDMEEPNGDPQEIFLKDLVKEWNRLQFLVHEESNVLQKELEVSIKAGELVGKIYDAFKAEFAKVRNGEPTAEDLHSLNVLCVRLVFCLYAEDAGIFNKDQFYHFMRSFRAENLREGLKALFAILDTKEADRDPFMDEKYRAFPYVNGNLFKEQPGEVIPRISEETANILLDQASLGFDWSEISPTIFGAVFESTLNPDTRRKGGMHYTSIENIHKVIDPLFLDARKAELTEIKSVKNTKERNTKLQEFRKSLGEETFFDPACGSGNFLTETYISLRNLENEALAEQHNGEAVLDVMGDEIFVNIHQFYGIEINDFAATVAKTALWIAECQMMQKTAEILHRNLEFLPLKSYGNIIVGNALQIDWSSLRGSVPPTSLRGADASTSLRGTDTLSSLRGADASTSLRGTDTLSSLRGAEGDEAIYRTSVPSFDYIIGNPPFVGYSLQSEEQKKDILGIYIDEKGKPYKTAGKIDFVSGWFFKAAQYMSENSKTKTALVSTNSITQGEQVSGVWKPLYDRFNIQIDFAYRTFRWDSESNSKAHVHCVIIGFSCCDESSLPRHCEELMPPRHCEELMPPRHCEEPKATKQSKDISKSIFNSDGSVETAKNINAYLVDGPNVFVDSRSKPICKIPAMIYGNKPTDGGFLFLTKEERDDALKKDASIEKFIKRILGAEEFINNKERYCIWLKNASPAEIKNSKFLLDRVNGVKTFRLASTKEATRISANTPFLFQEIRQPNDEYIIIPRHSSENRTYIPLGFENPEVIVNDAVQIIPSATLFHFGVLTSSVHMAWMRAVCGRLEMRYRYSKDVVYNNFPWPVDCFADARNDVKENARNDVGKNARNDVKENVRNDVEEKIEKTAQAILDARALYPDCSLADLYDETTMPIELRKAHQANDAAVMAAYGFNKNMTESEIVAELLKMYQQLVSGETRR